MTIKELPVHDINSIYNLMGKRVKDLAGMHEDVAAKEWSDRMARFYDVVKPGEKK